MVDPHMMVVFGLVLESTPELLLDWLEAELPNHRLGLITLVGGEEVTPGGYEVSTPTEDWAHYVLTFSGIVWSRQGEETNTSLQAIHHIEMRLLGDSRTELLAESYDHPGYLEFLASIRERLVQVFPSRDTTPDPPSTFLLRSKVLAAVDEAIVAELANWKREAYTFRRREYPGFTDYGVFGELSRLGYIRLSPSHEKQGYKLTFLPCHHGSTRVHDKWQVLRDGVRDAVETQEKTGGGSSMELPAVRLREQQDVFDKRLRRYVQEAFPQLTLTMRPDGPARRYEVTREQDLLAEIDTLPLSDRLEVRVARPSSDDGGFCQGFWEWMQQAYKNNLEFASGIEEVFGELPVGLAQHQMERLADFEDPDPEKEELRRELLDTARKVLPPVEETEPTPGEEVADRETEDYVFRKQGKVWEIAFRADKVYIPDNLLGLSYIARLLANPDVELHVLDIEDVRPRGERLPEVELDRLGMHVATGSNSDQVLDAKAEKEYARRLEQIREERREAKESLDDDKLQQREEELDKEVEWIDREWRAATGLGGRSRRHRDEGERERQNVQKAIVRAIEEIGTENPELAAHLDRFIDTGQECVYKPYPPVHWNTQ